MAKQKHIFISATLIINILNKGKTHMPASGKFVIIILLIILVVSKIAKIALELILFENTHNCCMLACPNCGHHFKQKWYWRSKITSDSLIKSIIAKCPECKKRDLCTLTMDDYYK